MDNLTAFTPPLVILLLGLILATGSDLLRHRIPNMLCAAMTTLGLFLQGGYAGWLGIGAGLAGFAVGLLGLLPFYLLRGMGAGDVKLMASAGVFLGPLNALLCVGLTLVSGALIGLLLLLIRGGIADAWRRYSLYLKTLAYTFQHLYQPPSPTEVAAQRFPYALAITSGVIWTLLWQAPGEWQIFQSLTTGIRPG